MSGYNGLGEKTHEFSLKAGNRLEEALRRLSGMLSSREKLFLSLGSGIQEIAGKSREMTVSASALVDAASGERTEGVIAELDSIMAGIGETCSLDEFDDGILELDNKKGLINALIVMVRDFRRIVRYLQVLGISTRIESARMGEDGRGFQTLADDVENLSKVIHEHTVQILENGLSLLKLVEEACEKTLAIRESQKFCGTQMVEEMRQSLEKLLEMKRNSFSFSERMSHISREIASNIGETVASLQFHDIVRQRVEHVEEIVRETRNILQTESVGKKGSQPEDEQAVDAWVGDVCRLQKSQLEFSRREFFTAVTGFRDNLRSISSACATIPEGIRKLSGEDERKGASLMKVIEFGVMKTREYSDLQSRQGASVELIMKEVGETVKRMVEFIDDVEDVGSEIQLIALNASVKAAHTGEEGRALGVLAVSIQRISKDAREQTSNVAGILKKLAIDSGGKRSGNDEMIGSAGDELNRRLGGLLDELTRADEAVTAGKNALSLLAEEVADRVDRLAKGITFHYEVDKEIKEIEFILGGIVDSASDVTHGAAVKQPERLQELFKRYTMESERIVHQKTFGERDGKSSGGGEPVSVRRMSARPPEDEYLGDNVELF